MKKIFHLACFAFILLAAACSDEKEVTLEYNKIDGLLLNAMNFYLLPLKEKIWVIS